MGVSPDLTAWPPPAHASRQKQTTTHPRASSPLACEHTSKGGCAALTWHKTHCVPHADHHLLFLQRTSRIRASFSQLHSLPHRSAAPTPKFPLACITLDLKGLSYLPCLLTSPVASRGRPAPGPGPERASHSCQHAPGGGTQPPDCAAREAVLNGNQSCGSLDKTLLRSSNSLTCPSSPSPTGLQPLLLSLVLGMRQGLTYTTPRAPLKAACTSCALSLHAPISAQRSLLRGPCPPTWVGLPCYLSAL